MGAECIPVEMGKEVVPKVLESVPLAVILDVFMPQVSGMELCRQVKEATGNRTPVVLISATPSETIAQRAADYGCDLYVMKEEAEAQILRFIHAKMVEARVDNPRVAPRYELSGMVRYLSPKGERIGELMNASESGVLFAAEDSVTEKTPLTLIFEGIGKGSFQVETVVVRWVPLKSPQGNFKCALGCKFKPSSVDDQNKIKAVLDYSRRERLRLNPTQVHQLLDLKEADVRGVFQGNDDPLGLRALSGPLSEIERQAFSEDSPLFELIRRSILIRLHTG